MLTSLLWAHPYSDARLKVKRAKKHVEDLESTIVANEQSCVATIERNPETGAESLVHTFPDFEGALDGLSLIVGDALHNARTALDFAWRDTIDRRLHDELSSHTSFPVRDTREDVENALRGIHVHTRCKPLFDCIMVKIQPYNGGHNSAAWTLHDLDISDKHHWLLGLNPQGQVRGITVRDVDGECYRGCSHPADGVNGRYVIDFEPGIHVKDKGRLSVAVMLQQAGIFKPVPVVSLLNSFSNFALYVVELLENI